MATTNMGTRHVHLLLRKDQSVEKNRSTFDETAVFARARVVFWCVSKHILMTASLLSIIGSKASQISGLYHTSEPVTKKDLLTSWQIWFIFQLETHLYLTCFGFWDWTNIGYWLNPWTQIVGRILSTSLIITWTGMGWILLTWSAAFWITQYAVSASNPFSCERTNIRVRSLSRSRDIQQLNVVKIIIFSLG